MSPLYTFLWYTSHPSGSQEGQAVVFCVGAASGEGDEVNATESHYLWSRSLWWEWSLLQWQYVWFPQAPTAVRGLLDERESKHIIYIYIKKTPCGRFSQLLNKQLPITSTPNDFLTSGSDFFFIFEIVSSRELLLSAFMSRNKPHRAINRFKTTQNRQIVDITWVFKHMCV